MSDYKILIATLALPVLQSYKHIFGCLSLLFLIYMYPSVFTRNSIYYAIARIFHANSVRPTVHPIPIPSTFGSRVVFTGSADRMALFPVR